MSDGPERPGLGDATTGRETHKAPDPAPYAYLDDDARMAGAISPGATTGFGVFFLAFTVALVIVSFAYDAHPGLWFALVFGLIGGQLVRMGLARRAWRARNPGVDPLSTVPSPTGGSAYGPDTRAGSVGRWVLLVLCVVLGLLFVVTLIASFTAGSTVTVATQVVLLVLSVLVLSVGWFDLRRIRRVRAERTHSPQGR